MNLGVILHQYMTGSDMKKFGFLSVSLVTIMLVASTAHAEIASKAYVDNLIDPVATQISTHAADTDIHVTTAEKAEWDAKQDALGYTAENVANKVTSADGYNDYFNNTKPEYASRDVVYPTIATVDAMIDDKNNDTLGALAAKIDTTITGNAATVNANKNVVMVRNNTATYVPSRGNAVSVANDGTITVNEATKATQDGSGNTITSTYATKDELSTATTNAANTYATQTALSDGLALKQNASDSTATAGNYISAGTGVGANLGALDTATKNAKDAADVAALTANAAIPQPDEECESAANKCVLTYNNSTYYWEVIGR